MLEDGTIIPNLTGAADITAMQARLKSEDAYPGGDLRIPPWLLLSRFAWRLSGWDDGVLGEISFSPTWPRLIATSLASEL